MDKYLCLYKENRFGHRWYYLNETKYKKDKIISIYKSNYKYDILTIKNIIHQYLINDITNIISTYVCDYHQIINISFDNINTYISEHTKIININLDDFLTNNYDFKYHKDLLYDPNMEVKEDFDLIKVYIYDHIYKDFKILGTYRTGDSITRHGILNFNDKKYTIYQINSDYPLIEWQPAHRYSNSRDYYLYHKLKKEYRCIIE